VLPDMKMHISMVDKVARHMDYDSIKISDKSIVL
jgi:hypothetical protein